MKVWGTTDVGLVRKENQDAYAIETIAGATVAVVCDGMGGVSGGQIASSVAVQTYMDVLRESIVPGASVDELPNISRRGVKQANDAIRARAGAEAGLYQMGTTLVSAIYRDGMALITNVGDSRAYRANAEGLSQITHDHSMVESMVAHGDISPQEARHHPNRNIITRALGPDAVVEADTFAIPVAIGDSLLLCSDGLVNTVSDQEILFEIIHAADSDSCLNRLLDISKQRGASDNVTIVLMQVDN